MTQTTRSWLPPEALDRGPVREALGGAIADWSSRWFRGHVAEATTYLPLRVSPSQEGGWRFPGQSIGLAASRSAMDRLMAWTLDVRLPDGHRTPRDREVLDHVEASLLADLAEGLETGLGLPHEPRHEALLTASAFDEFGGLVVQIGDDHGALLVSVAVPLDAALPLARAGVVKNGKIRPPLTPMRQALADTPLVVDAILGQAELLLSDLQGLALGDTLILDRALNDAADLTLNGAAAVFARAKLTDADGQVGLLLQA